MNLINCTNWLCPTQNDINEYTSQSEFNTYGVLGPSPTPDSSNSCDDPPLKNCYRLVMLGSARAGKTSLVSRFLGGKYQDSYTPTIENFHRKIYRIRGELHQLDLLDTSGNHPFPATRRLTILTGDLFVIVFSMDSRESFEEAIRLRADILETKLKAGAASNSGLFRKKNLARVPMVLAGNKCDKDMRAVTVGEAITYCKRQDSNCIFVETSAKANLRVDDLFYHLFRISNLPLEMTPNHHTMVSPTFESPYPLPPPTASDHACGVLTPNVPRPSIRTDLMTMHSKTIGNGNRNGIGDTATINRRRLEHGCVLL